MNSLPKVQHLNGPALLWPVIELVIIMTVLLLRISDQVMTGVRVNRIQQQTRNGARVFVKKRRFGGSIAIWFGNTVIVPEVSGVSLRKLLNGGE